MDQDQAERIDPVRCTDVSGVVTPHEVIVVFKRHLIVTGDQGLGPLAMSAAVAMPWGVVVGLRDMLTQVIEKRQENAPLPGEVKPN